MMAIIDAVFGFRQIGCPPSIGFKFGRWTDMVMVQATARAKREMGALRRIRDRRRRSERGDVS